MAWTSERPSLIHRVNTGNLLGILAFEVKYMCTIMETTLFIRSILEAMEILGELKQNIVTDLSVEYDLVLLIIKETQVSS